MDLFQLETFLAVAEERSFSRAAVRLHRTQPAVSQAISKLEAELGETLFERSMRDGSLTDAGEVLREYALKLINLRSEAAGALQELRSLHRGKLSLAANEYTCLYLLPVLDRFRRQHPRVQVVIQRQLASRIPDDVLAHSNELGVLSFRPEDAQLRSIAVYRDTLALIVNPRHRLARVPEVTIKELGSEMFVAHNVASPQRAKVHEAFRRHKTNLRIDVELPSLDAVKRFVQMGNGVALVPGLTVQHEIASGSLVQVPVKDLQMERKLRIVHRRHATLSHVALAFLDEVEQYARTAGDPFTFQVERGPA